MDAAVRWCPIPPDIYRGFHDVDAIGADAVFEDYVVAMHGPGRTRSCLALRSQ